MRLFGATGKVSGQRGAFRGNGANLGAHQWWCVLGGAVLDLFYLLENMAARSDVRATVVDSLDAEAADALVAVLDAHLAVLHGGVFPKAAGSQIVEL